MKTREDVLHEALKDILGGSRRTGRWVCTLTGDAIDGDYDQSQVPDGCYDTDSALPDEDDDSVDRSHVPLPSFLDQQEPSDVEDVLFVGGRWLTPATWEPYTASENRSWLDSVADIAERSLKAVEAMPAMIDAEAHFVRVTELLTANNVEVERRREAERLRGQALDALQIWYSSKPMIVSSRYGDISVTPEGVRKLLTMLDAADNRLKAAARVLAS